MTATIDDQPAQNPLAFKYHDGTKYVYADPYKIYRRIFHGRQAELNELITIADTDNEHIPVEDIEEAENQLEEIICDAFQLNKMDPQTGIGLTSDELRNIWISYCKFNSELQKKTLGPQNQSASLE